MLDRLKPKLGGALLLLAACANGCSSNTSQYPAGSYPGSSGTGNSNSQQTQTSGNPAGSATGQPAPRSGRAGQHVMESMAQGAQWGGMLAGPFAHFGALGGMAIGALYGIFTIGAEEERVVAQVNKEAQKDQQLEALIEQELERQRALEGQIINASGSATPPAPTSAAKSAGESGKPTASTPPAQQDRARENVAVAAINKPTPVNQPTPASPFKNVEVRDINGDGIADLWIYYNPQKAGEIVRQEEATKGDGRVDTWSYFKDGKLLRREVDTQGQGRPTTIYFYNDDKIVREERDEIGQGMMTYRGLYENGRIAKVERDSGGRGRPDLWIYYDTTRDGEIVVKEERDLNGDGVADVWTYFENGRVVRRDVSVTGLEILSKQEQFQVPVAELRPVSLPGS